MASQSTAKQKFDSGRALKKLRQKKTANTSPFFFVLINYGAVIVGSNTGRPVMGFHGLAEFLGQILYNSLSGVP